VNDLRDELLNKLKSSQTGIDRRINNLITTHLTREGAIGEGDDCPSKTLIDYTMGMLPTAMAKIKAAEEHIS